MHGNDVAPQDVVANDGLGANGDNYDLLEHARPQPGMRPSGLRGTTEVLSTPDGQGAANWGKWVYDIDGVPTYDVNRQLAGRVPKVDGFGGNPFHGEGENAIPARVPLARIKRWGRVEESASGQKYVPEWTTNPAYEPPGG